MKSDIEERISIMFQEFTYLTMEHDRWSEKPYLKQQISKHLAKLGESGETIDTFIDLMYLLGAPWNYLK